MGEGRGRCGRAGERGPSGWTGRREAAGPGNSPAQWERRPAERSGQGVGVVAGDISVRSVERLSQGQERKTAPGLAAWLDGDVVGGRDSGAPSRRSLETGSWKAFSEHLERQSRDREERVPSTEPASRGAWVVSPRAPAQRGWGQSPRRQPLVRPWFLLRAPSRWGLPPPCVERPSRAGRLGGPGRDVV